MFLKALGTYNTSSNNKTWFRKLIEVDPIALAATLAPFPSFKVTSFGLNFLSFDRSSKDAQMWELVPISNTHALDELLEHLEANKLEKVLLSPSLPFPFIFRDSTKSGQFLFQYPSPWQWKYFPLPCSSLTVALGLTTLALPLCLAFHLRVWQHLSCPYVCHV